MKRTRLIGPALAILALLLATNSSRADLEIALQEAGVNGGAITVVATGADFSAASFTGAYGDFSVKVFGGSSDNGATLSDLLQSTTSVTNTNATSAATLHLYVSQTNYTLPTGANLSVESGLGGSVNQGTVGLTGIFQAYASNSNTLFDTTQFTNGLQTATQTGTTFDTGSAFGTFARTSAMYSLTTEVNFTLSAGGQANYSSHENLTAPAPAGVVLALTGLPFLGIGTWLRRRKAEVQNS